MTSFGILLPSPRNPRATPAQRMRHADVTLTSFRHSRFAALFFAAVMGATTLAQEQGTQAPPASAPTPIPPDEPRAARLKTDAVAEIDAMSVFTQQMVDSVFSFG